MFVVGMVLAALATGLIGMAVELTLLRRIYRAPELFQLLATFGVVLIVQDITPTGLGTRRLAAAPPQLAGCVARLSC